MERIQPMNELQIQQKVEDLAGKSAKIIECEQNTLSQMEEVLLVNGIKISLVGEEGAKIKEALIQGEVPHCDLVNNMLIRAGIETNPVELETTVNVKSSVKTSEHYQLKDSKGLLVDEKMKEKEDEDEFRTVNVEIWSLEDQMIEPENTPKNTTIATTTAATTKGGGGAVSKINKEPENASSKSHPQNKKSKFSPLSSIIKPNKSDKSQKQSKKSQQQQQQQQQQHQPVVMTNAAGGNTAPPVATTQASTAVVSKNKFLSLFTKGKSKDKNLPDNQHSGLTKNKDKDSSATSQQSNKSNKRITSNAKNNKSSNNQDNESKNKQQVDNSSNNTPAKIETKKQHFNVNYLDPSKSLVQVEIDGIPVRVAYETFV